MLGVAAAQRAKLLLGLVVLEIVEVVHRPVQLGLDILVEQQPFFGVHGHGSDRHAVERDLRHDGQGIGRGGAEHLGLRGAQGKQRGQADERKQPAKRVAFIHRAEPVEWNKALVQLGQRQDTGRRETKNGNLTIT